MDNTKLLSAFAVHSKRRRSAETTPGPARPKRTRSAVSESQKPEISKTSKLSLLPQVSIEDIAKTSKKTPKRATNGMQKTVSEDEEITQKKSPKKKRKSEFSAAVNGKNAVEVEDVAVATGNASTVTDEIPKIKKEGKGEQQDKRSLKSEKNKRLSNSKVLPDDKANDEREEILNNINPLEEATTLFNWLIHPVVSDDFFKNHWEKAPLHIKRNSSSYYRLLMTNSQIDDILRRYHILFTKNLDLTAYVNGKRETYNPEGRARPSVVWDYYSNGCSVRMLNPQTFIPKLHNLNASLQEFFHCFVGANFYLTPPGSQGFAPHYDDIEAFILQIEGKKRWRLYKPRNVSEFLPRYSSKNFDSSEIGQPILDVVLSAGDFLYFPRGTIHQGETLEDAHSLHVTLSVYQRNCWGDFLEKLVPEALRTAISEDSDFRVGLPLGYLRDVGSAYAGRDSNTRRMMMEKTRELLHRMIEKIDLDKAADEMAKGHIHDYLPPVLAPVELQCSVCEDGERMVGAKVVNRVEIEPDTMIRLARQHAVRLIRENNTWRIYYSADNTKEYHEVEQQFLEVGDEYVTAIMQIIETYPEFIKVDDLEIEGEQNKIQVARDLWEKGIILSDVPLPVLD
ncbi:bifunctional lysine-specific demethylase and histidyl-hydroxylase NO66 [Fopius arisanus]|uniref:Bifunctional lysine-specific demethylase and histidyl-hydroxylase n=2 Tax=Fopius arisanus TaxID=64838 RepID=A0A9R1T7K4_9HYME|nr:PREDICTED: bifunctional lysine-specific demethylase and histidyl-hydroxylase NO66 [Fopius arisanus]